MEEALKQRFYKESGQAMDIALLVEPVLEEMGFRLVRVQVGGDDPITLQIMAEKPDGTLNVEDCADISRNLSPLLDAHDMISDRYYLEVSSPGIGRPLVRGEDFLNWVGYEAKITLSSPIDGQKRFRGEIAGFENGEALLKMTLSGKDDPVVLGFAGALIEKATLIMSDALLDAAKKAGKERHKEN